MKTQPIRATVIKNFWKRHKWVLLSLLVPIVSFIFGYFLYTMVASFRQLAVTSQMLPVPTKTIRAVMWLEPETLNAGVGKPIMMRLMFDAKGAVINGADAVLLFDPKKVRINNVVTDNKDAQSSTPPPFLYFQKVDKQKGKAAITAIKQTADAVPTTVMRLATITFTPIVKGETAIGFEHFPGKTNGSTAIRAADNVNILDTATGMTITIQ